MMAIKKYAYQKYNMDKVEWSWLCLASIVALLVNIITILWLLGFVSMEFLISRSWLAHMRLLKVPTISTISVAFGGMNSLLLTRSLSFGYMVIVVVVGIIIDGSLIQDAGWDVMGGMSPLAFAFYDTDWTFILTLVFFCCSSLVSLSDVTSDVTTDEEGEIFRRVQTPMRRRIETYLWIMCETSTTAALVVAVMYWAFVVGMGCSQDNSCDITFYSANAHGAIVALVLIEMIVDSFIWEPWHFVFPLAFIFAWELLSVCVYAATGVFIYSVQDPKLYGNVIAYGFYPIFAAVHILFFFVLLGINRLIRYLARKKYI